MTRKTVFGGRSCECSKPVRGFSIEFIVWRLVCAALALWFLFCLVRAFAHGAATPSRQSTTHLLSLISYPLDEFLSGHSLADTGEENDDQLTIHLLPTEGHSFRGSQSFQRVDESTQPSCRNPKDPRPTQEGDGNAD